MFLHFIGADHEVTGSCHLIEAGGHWVMVDRGMEQGKNLYENEDLPCAPADVDAILLTHAHIDHSGLIPLMYAQGFRGKIYATPATCDLCDIMLRDSAHIQEFEAEWRNRKGQRLNKEPFVPLYTMADAMGAVTLFQEMEYGTVSEILPGFKIRFTDVGHLLGSSCIEVWVEEDGKEEKLLFSGDLGNHDQPLLKDPQTVDTADYLIIESTYGDRLHEMRVDYIEELVPILQRTFDRGGNVVIPSFAVGRTQEMLYFFRHIKEKGLITGHDGFKVVVDSPLANEATTVFNKHTQDCFDEEALALVEKGINPITFPGLTLSITSDDSVAINADTEPKVILSASGMCDAGRIKHHLKHNLWRPESTVLFVGFQSEGTLGRMLLDGIKEVKLFGEQISVQAEIMNLPGISGHADRDGLLKWAGALEKAPKMTFVVHGEDTVTDTFAELLASELGYPAEAPYSGSVYDLAEGQFKVRKEGVPAGSAEPSPDAPALQTRRRITSGDVQRKKGVFIPLPAGTDPSSIYGRLIAEVNRLAAAALKMQGHSKKEIGNMRDEVAYLADQWEDDPAEEQGKKKKK